MSSAAYLLQKTYQILCCCCFFCLYFFFVFFCILLKCCKSRNGTVGSVGNKPNDKTRFNQRTGKHYKVHYIDTSIKIRSNFFYRSHDTILIRLSMEIERQPILKRYFLFDFCVNIIRSLTAL